MKRIILSLLFLIMLYAPMNVFALSFIESSGILNGSKFSYKSQSVTGNGHDVIFVDFSNDNVQKFSVQSFGQDSTFSNPGTLLVKTASQLGVNKIEWVELTCNVYYEMFVYGSNNNIIGHAKLRINELVNPSCSSDGDGTGDDGASDCGCVFESPAWGDYMGKIDEIINSIPPPPNWNDVADTFRDSIVPKVINDLDNLLGKAPALPDAPNYPTIDTPTLDIPTGQEDPALGDASFTDSDIKNEAPEIEFREDPTGGFNILDPIGQLPSQDEFKANIPNEPDLDFPNVPDVEGEAPNPPQEKIPFPNAPDVSGTAPIPDDAGGKAPIPNEGNNTAPMPGDNSGNAPIPGADNSTAPIPGNDGSTAPIPNK